MLILTDREPEEKRFKFFYVTDSCPTVTEQIDGKGPFIVLSNAEAIYQSIVEYRM